MGLIRAVYCRKGKDESGSARKPEIEFSNAAPSPMSCFFRWEACSSTFTRTECSLDMPRRRLYICMPCRVNQVFFVFFSSSRFLYMSAPRPVGSRCIYNRSLPCTGWSRERVGNSAPAPAPAEAYARHFLSCA